MCLRRVRALLRAGVCASIAGVSLTGCTHSGGLGAETASIGSTLRGLAFPAPDEARMAREEAIIAQAIAAHEMRNP